MEAQVILYPQDRYVAPDCGRNDREAEYFLRSNGINAPIILIEKRQDYFFPLE